MKNQLNALQKLLIMYTRNREIRYMDVSDV